MAAVSVANLHIFCSEISNKDHYHQQQFFSNTTRASRRVCSANGAGLWGDDAADRGRRRKSRRSVHSDAFWQGTAKPTTVAMDPVTSTEHLDQILSEAQQASPPKPVIIDWMANWCRKCIYLKPKLEKLAAEYDTRLKFYYVDVNNVSQTLVKRGNISKMPTIQLWKDGEMKEEVIGGHKAWLVIDEVKEMIEKYI